MTSENAPEIIVTIQPTPMSTAEKVLGALVLAGLAYWVWKGPHR